MIPSRLHFFVMTFVYPSVSTVIAGSLSEPYTLTYSNLKDIDFLSENFGICNIHLTTLDLGHILIIEKNFEFIVSKYEFESYRCSQLKLPIFRYR